MSDQDELQNGTDNVCLLVDIETEDRHWCCLGFIIVYGSRRPEGLVNITDTVWQEKFIIT